MSSLVKAAQLRGRHGDDAGLIDVLYLIGEAPICSPFRNGTTASTHPSHPRDPLDMCQQPRNFCSLLFEGPDNFAVMKNKIYFMIFPTTNKSIQFMQFPSSTQGYCPVPNRLYTFP